MVSYDEVSVGLYNYFLLKDVYFSKLSMLQDDFCAVSPYKDGNDFFSKLLFEYNLLFELENRKKKCFLDSILNVYVSFCNVHVSSATDYIMD